MSLGAEKPKGVRGLEPEETASDHRADRPAACGPRRFDAPAERVEVVERAVDEDAVEIVAGNRRNERRGSRGKDEVVVGDIASITTCDELGLAVDTGGTCVVDLDCVRQRVELKHAAVPAADVAREGDAVVGVAGLFGDDGDRSLRFTGENLHDRAVRDHPESDDNDVPREVSCGVTTRHGGGPFITNSVLLWLNSMPPFHVHSRLIRTFHTAFTIAVNSQITGNNRHSGRRHPLPNLKTSTCVS